MQQKPFRLVRPIVGAVLFGLGIFVFYEILGQAAHQLNCFLGTRPGEGLPTVLLAIWRLGQADAGSQTKLGHDLLRQMLLLSFPLLLVTVGTVLSRDTFPDNVGVIPEENSHRHVDRTSGRTTSE